MYIILESEESQAAEAKRLSSPHILITRMKRRAAKAITDSGVPIERLGRRQREQ